MQPDFMNVIAKIIADVHDRTCIDNVDTEVLEEILQGALKAYDDEQKEYYFDDGYELGYSEGYENGFSDGYSDGYYED